MPSGSPILFITLLLAFAAIVWGMAFVGGRIRLLFVKGPLMLRPLLHEYEQLINKAELNLALFSEQQAGEKQGEQWSKKEILGHLVDAAMNNHQRFVHAQISGEMKLASHDQAAWVRIQNYQSESWLSLVQLWCAYNRHLLHILNSLPSQSLRSVCFIGDDLPVTLESLIRDYISYLKLQLTQLSSPGVQRPD